ncbi:MAG: YihY/virulence factor BrkB family protein [Rickettsiales bacterium]|nr:MAG: YihY/virulence factor BrkB family protein [Rickettsiales bacterium]
MKNILRNLYLAIVKMVDHDGVEHAGYMAFMMLLSIFPFFIFILAFTSFFGLSELGEMFIWFTVDNLPENSIAALKTRIDEMIANPPPGLLTLAILGTLWTASSFIECLRTILNRVYEVKTPPIYILRRLLSIFQFLIIISAICFAMLILIIIPVILTKIHYFVILKYEYRSLINIAKYIFVFLSLFLTISSLYFLIPNISLKYSEVAPGALLAVILWSASGYLLTKYIIYYNQLSIVYGSLGSIIITLVFFYIINIIFIIGAEFNFLQSHKKSD